MMLRRATLAIALLPAVALAQDAPPAAPLAPTGVLLLEALPPTADLVIHTPDLRRFLASAPEAGLGTAEAWAAAFRDQLTRWGTAAGDGPRLVAAGEKLLALADGECVLASMPVPKLRRAPRGRGTVLAFRCKAAEPELRKAVDDVVAAGCRVRWSGDPRTDPVAGRAVTTFDGDDDSLSFRVENGFAAFSDSPVALGILFRGMERVMRTGGPAAPDAGRRLEVRWGRDDARWVAWTYLQRESVTWLGEMPGPYPEPAWDSVVLGLRWSPEIRELPLYPVPVPLIYALSGIGFLQDDGQFLGGMGSTGPRRPALAPAVGFASGGAWLRAFRIGGLPMPFGSSGALRPLDPLIEDYRKKSEVRTWTADAEAHQVHGPAWHGPATMMALRVLRDIANGAVPNVPPVEPQPPGKPGETTTPPKPQQPPPSPPEPQPPK